jgi:hypothetical protein
MKKGDKVYMLKHAVTGDEFYDNNQIGDYYYMKGSVLKMTTTTLG